MAGNTYRLGMEEKCVRCYILSYKYWMFCEQNTSGPIHEDIRQSRSA